MGRHGQVFSHFSYFKSLQLVMGPAGAGKSTYCDTIQKHCENSKRVTHVVNLDPAAEVFSYTPSIGITTNTEFKFYL